MAIENTETLKGYFETGKSPTQGNFEDLIESSVNKADAGITVDITNKNVGIGLEESASPIEKLEVNGAIRVGDTLNPLIQAGTIRWNPNADDGAGDLEGHDGQQWRSLISGGGWENEGSYTNTLKKVAIGLDQQPEATLDVNGTLRLRETDGQEGAPGTLRWHEGDLKLKMTDGDQEVNWTSLTQTNVFTKIKVYENENMGIGLDDHDVPEARVHIKGPVKIDGTLEVTDQLDYKGYLNETQGDPATPRVLEQSEINDSGTSFGDSVSYSFTRNTRMLVEASLPFLNGSCRAKIALCYKADGQDETIIDEAVVKVSEGALSTTTHAAVKLSGYVIVNATDEQNTELEFYTKIIAKESGTIRLNNSSLPEFNSFGTIQLIEI